MSVKYHHNKYYQALYHKFTGQGCWRMFSYFYLDWLVQVQEHMWLLDKFLTILWKALLLTKYINENCINYSFILFYFISISLYENCWEFRGWWYLSHKKSWSKHNTFHTGTHNKHNNAWRYLWIRIKVIITTECQFLLGFQGIKCCIVVLTFKFYS